MRVFFYTLVSVDVTPYYDWTYGEERRRVDVTRCYQRSYVAAKLTGSRPYTMRGRTLHSGRGSERGTGQVGREIFLLFWGILWPWGCTLVDTYYNGNIRGNKHETKARKKHDEDYTETNMGR